MPEGDPVAPITGTPGRDLRDAPRPRRLGPVGLILAAALVVLLAAEGGARLIGPYLPEPLVYGDEATQVKVHQMDALGPNCVDVVVAGNSMGRDAFVPAIFAASDPGHRKAYNASLDAASPELLQRWVLDEVVPRLHPTTVVIAVASLDLNAHGNATSSALTAYEAAPATEPGWFAHAEHDVARSSALIGYRRALRDPQALADAVGRWRSGTPSDRLSSAGIAGVLGADGEGLSRRPLHYRGDAGTKAFTRQELLAGYSIDARQGEALNTLVLDLQAQGIYVVLTVLPVTDDYVALHPRGQEDFDAFLETVRSDATRDGVALLDLHDARPGTGSFADTHHLNEAGSAWFSAALPTQLAGTATLRDRRCAA